MKTLKFIIILLFALTFVPQGKAQSSHQLLREFTKQNPENMHFTVPGFIVRFLSQGEMDDEAKEAIKKLKNISVYIAEHSSLSDYQHLVKSFQSEKQGLGGKTLMSINSDGDQINFLAVPSGKKNQAEFVFLIRGDDEETVAVLFRGKFTDKEQKQLFKTLQKKNWMKS